MAHIRTLIYFSLYLFLLLLASTSEMSSVFWLIVSFTIIVYIADDLSDTYKRIYNSGEKEKNIIAINVASILFILLNLTFNFMPSNDVKLILFL